MKEANIKWLHTVWFQLYDILGKAKLWRQEKDQWLPEVLGEEGIREVKHRRLSMFGKIIRWNIDEGSYYDMYFMDQIGHIWTYWLATSCYLVIKLCQMTPMDYSPPGSSVHGISQARILEWVSISFSRGSSQPRDRTHIFFIGRQILEPLEKPLCAFIKFILNLKNSVSQKGFR